MKGGVSVSIDLGAFAGQYGALLSQKIAADVFNKARELVRVAAIDGGQLRNSIKNVGITRSHFVVYAETPYAAMQELGPPDTPYWNNRRYSWTPYMTPAAEFAGSAENLNRRCSEVVDDFKAKMNWRSLHGI